MDENKNGNLFFYIYILKHSKEKVFSGRVNDEEQEKSLKNAYKKKKK